MAIDRIGVILSTLPFLFLVLKTVHVTDNRLFEAACRAE